MSAVYHTSCSWCQYNIFPHDLITQNSNHHRDWLTTLLQNWLPVKQASDDITSVIIGFIYKPDIFQSKFICHKSCLDFTRHTTRSGRKTKMVRRLQDEEYIPGSGVAGCDSYDNSYNSGYHWDWEKNHWTSHLFRRPDDDDFVVGEDSGELEVISSEVLSSDEGEWDSDEEDSDEDDDEEHDWD
jgi:hypothetical protein